MKLKLYTSAVIAAALMADNTTQALKIQQVNEATDAALFNSMSLALPQTCTDADLMSMTEIQAELKTLVQAYAAVEADTEAQAMFIQKIKDFATKYILPVVLFIAALIGLNALNPWVTSFIKDWHRSHPGTCMYPGGYPASTAYQQTYPYGVPMTPVAASQTLREELQLTEAEAHEIANMLVQILSDASGDNIAL